jgi:uncharacterized protein (DUF4415 family)
MTKERNIKRYTVEEINSMREGGEDQTDWTKVDAMTQKEIEAAIDSDPDEATIAWDWEKAELVMPTTKTHVNLRLDADVLHFFRSQGKGYQTRINAVLRRYMQAQRAKNSNSLPPKRAS